MGIHEFREQVHQAVDNLHFNMYGHNLPTVTYRYRSRYLETLKRGFDMPTAYYYLCIGQRLADFNYLRYLGYAWSHHNPQVCCQQKRSRVLVINLL